MEINNLLKVFLNLQEMGYMPGTGRRGTKGTRMIGNPVGLQHGRPCRVGLSSDSRKRRRRVAFGLLRNPLSHNAIHTFLYSHDENLTRSAENQKTYGRLFGMIFFGGSEPMLIPYLQRFATQKIFKSRQNTKAKLIFIFQNIDFSAKTPQKGPVFSVSTNKSSGSLSLRCCGLGYYAYYWNCSFLAKIRPIAAAVRRRIFG